MKAIYTFLTGFLLLLFIAPGLHAQSMGTASESLKNSVSLSHPYPNPASTSVTIDFDLGERQSGNLCVYNLLGRKLKTYVLSQQDGKAMIPVHELTPGLYFIRLEVPDSEVVMRKIKVVR